MQLVVLHHHLNPGGVTRVIQNHLLALATLAADARPDRVVLLYGGRCQGWPHDEIAQATPFDVSAVAVKQLDYQELTSDGGRGLPEAIADALAAAGANPDDTILHWHNHSLGKNEETPAAVVELFRLGYRTLLQIHDFAEDFRPENYRLLRRGSGLTEASTSSGLLYPQAKAIHYAVLNGRDREILGAAGVDRRRLHLLPNPVSPPQVDQRPQVARRRLTEALELPAEGPLFLYPVRGIRRKNLGEFLLWSAANPEARFVLTLAPKNPVERLPFDRWAELASDLQLACRLGIPAEAGVSFAEALAASDSLATTSVAEGFGMTFLEAWLAGRRLVGRDLPEITSDFTAAGLDLAELAAEVRIPYDWIDADELVAELGRIARGLYEAFGRTPPNEQQLYETIGGMSETGIDFARLPTTLQRQAIRRTRDSDSQRERLLRGNPRLRTPQDRAPSLVAANAAIVQDQFSLAALGVRLAEVYETTFLARADGVALPLERQGSILESFLRLDRLHPVRIEE